jgi:serine/threonine protein kinase
MGTVELGPYRVVDEVRFESEVARWHAFHAKTGERVQIRLVGEFGIGDQIQHALALVGKRHPHVEEVLFVGPRPNGAFVVHPDAATIDLGVALGREPDARDLPAIAVAVLADALEGLDFLHHASIVHGALSPSTLRITREGRALVTDVGRRSSTGKLRGDLRCLSPEQIEGAVPDVRADLFALGTVVYAVASGKAPFEGPTAVATLRRVSQVDYRPLADVVAGAPFALSDFVDRVLRKNPSARPGSAREVAQKLEGLANEIERGRRALADLFDRGKLPKHTLSTTAPHLAPLFAPDEAVERIRAVVVAPIAAPEMPVAPVDSPKPVPASDVPKANDALWEEGPTSAFEAQSEPARAPPRQASDPAAPFAQRTTPLAARQASDPTAPFTQRVPPLAASPVASPISRPVPPLAASLARGRRVDSDGFPVWLVPVIFGGLLFVVVVVVILVVALR